MDPSPKRGLERHYGDRKPINAAVAEVFAYIDDHARLSSHMNKPSWMMGGGRMNTSVDEGNGQRVGSHIRMHGKVLGIKLFLDEVVTRREPPLLKIWETIGELTLFIIGHYRMGIELEPQASNSILHVFIDYDLPITNAWLGQLFGGIYAKWCVQRMLRDTQAHFANFREGNLDE